MKAFLNGNDILILGFGGARNLSINRHSSPVIIV